MVKVIFFILLFTGICQAQSEISFRPYVESKPVRQESVAWKDLVSSLRQHFEKNTLDKDVRISFLNTPYGKYCVEDLMAYTLSGDGSVVIQMRDQLKNIKVAPEEMRWMADFLLKHSLEDLPDEEPYEQASAEFKLTLRVDGKKKTLRLYNIRNGKDRELIWEYLYSFGFKLLQAAGLCDPNKPIMPVCKGITDIDEIDSQADSLTDWLRIKFEFYSFKSGDFTFDFCGRKSHIFLSQGNTVYYAYINAYLLGDKPSVLSDYSKFSLDTDPPNPKGPYVMDLERDIAPYKNRVNLRSTPDVYSRGAVPLFFDVKLNQEVVLEMYAAGSGHEKGLVRFIVKDVQPDKLVIGNNIESIAVTSENSFFLHDIDCIGCVLTLSRSSGTRAVLLANWLVPDRGAIENKIRHFKEALASGGYHGNKEQTKVSLDNARSCRDAIDKTGDLRVNVIYMSPE